MSTIEPDTTTTAAAEPGDPATLTTEELESPVRTRSEVTITVAVEGAASRTFTADATTTGHPVVAARRLLFPIASQGTDWCHGQDLENDGAFRLAAVTALVTAGGETKTIESDTTTNCDPHEAAAALIAAAEEDLNRWLAGIGPAPANGDED